MNLEIDTKALYDLAKQFESFANVVGHGINRFLDEAGQITKEEMKLQEPKDTGKIQEDTKSVLHKTEKFVEVFPDTDYAKFIISGSKPNRTAPPINAIQGWAMRHGINPYALQKSIAKKGTSQSALSKYGNRANDFKKRTENEVFPKIKEKSKEIAKYIFKDKIL